MKMSNSEYVKKIINATKDKRPEYGTIHAINGNTIDIRAGTMPGIIRHVSVVGDVNTVIIGDTVSLIWSRSGRPVAYINNNAKFGTVEQADTSAQTEFQESVSLQMTSLASRIQEVYEAPLNNPAGYLGGWTLTGSSISTGEGSNFTCLSGSLSEYAIWSGNEDPELALFTVKKDGSIKASSGLIAGWTIGTDEISAGSGNFVLKAGASPYLGLGGATTWGETGIWLGDNGGTYQMYIGEYLGPHIKWDGADLEVVGNIFSSSGEIGGWTIGTNKIEAAGSDVTLQAGDYPFIGLDGSTGYNQTGIWLGKDTDDIYKMFIGSPIGGHLRWDGSDLTIAGKMIFEEQEASLVSGWLIVAKGSGTFRSDVGSSDTQIDFGQAMTPGDYVLVRAHDATGTAQSEYILVGALVSQTTYSVTRTSPQAWLNGTIYQVLGQVGDGYIELSAEQQRMSVLEQTATPTAPDEVVRIGELTGWQSASLAGNGLAIGDYSGGTYLSYDPTNGLLVKGTINADDGYLGDLDIAGDLTVNATGRLVAGNGNVVIDPNGIVLCNYSNDIRFGMLDRSTYYGYGSIGGMWYGTHDIHYQLWIGAYEGTQYSTDGTILRISSLDDYYGVFTVFRNAGPPEPIFNITSTGSVQIMTDVPTLQLGFTGDVALSRSAPSELNVNSDIAVDGQIIGGGMIDPAAVLASLPGLQGAWTHATIASSGLAAQYPVKFYAGGTDVSNWSGVSLSARYLTSGRTCTVSVSLIFTANPSLPVGNWEFSLPFPVAAIGAHPGQWLGSAHLRNAGVGNYERIVSVAGQVDNANVQLFIRPYDGINIDYVHNTYPFTWGVGDSLMFSVTYEYTNGYGI